MRVGSQRYRTVQLARCVPHADSTGRYLDWCSWIFRRSRTSQSRICRLVFLMSLVSFAATTLVFLGRFHSPETREELVVEPRLVNLVGPTQERVNPSPLPFSTSRFQDLHPSESTEENASRNVQPIRSTANTTAGTFSRGTDSTPTSESSHPILTFLEKYRHQYSKNATEFFYHLKGIKQQDWKPNAKNNREFRVDVRSELGHAGSVDVFSLTKSIAPVGKVMRFCVGGRTHNISKTLWNYLPEYAPFTASGQFKSCSVVGSSGILTGSGCGQQIDRSQFILRFNIAPVKGFEADVGSKTNFTTLNPSYIQHKMNGLKKKANCSQFGAVLKQFNGSNLWLPAFGVWRYSKLMELAAGAAVKSKVVQPLLGNPEHFLSVAKLWRKMAKSKHVWPTTGLYLILTLIDVCDQLDLFGFWPYGTSIDGRNVPYHYHNSITGKTSVHSFDTEFKTLVNLHEQGIIKMHFGSCL